MDRLILCMKWGTMYGPEYVNILYGMVSRNLTGPFRMVCFTDDGSDLRPEVEVYPLPDLGCEVPAEAPGKWPKQALWGKNLFGLEGVALFLDLDSVIVDSLDPYFEYGDPEDVITARNWVKPWLKMAQTSVFRFKIGAHSYMLENLQKDPQMMVKYRFEQNYVSSCIRGGVKFWPKDWTKHFGMHCLRTWPFRFAFVPKLPKGARIITFPGRPKPDDAILGRWSYKREFRPLWAHIRWAIGQRKESKRWRKFIFRFIRPTPWVAEHWRE